MENNSRSTLPLQLDYQKKLQETMWKRRGQQRCQFTLRFSLGSSLSKELGVGRTLTKLSLVKKWKKTFLTLLFVNSLNGKPVAETPSTLTRNAPRGQPDFQWKVGNLRFIRKYRKIAPAVVGGHPSTPKNEPGTSFKGRGSTLKGENTHQNHT